MGDSQRVDARVTATGGRQWCCRDSPTQDMVTEPPNRRMTRVQARCILHDGECSTLENEGEKTLIMSTADGAQLRKMTFEVADVNRALGSVSKVVRNENRVVFCASGSYIENKMTNDMLWLRERDGV